MRIAVDAMGGDLAPVETVKGAIAAAREYGIEIVLVGDVMAIKTEVAKDIGGVGLTIEPSASIIPMDEHSPSTAWRRQPDSSLSVMLRMLAEGQVDAAVSAGNTGAVVAGGTFILRRIEGIDRPALGVPFPTPGENSSKVFIADVGATPDAKPHYLLQWARMSSVYMERVLGVRNPRVGLVSNGEEEVKGSELVRETYPLLQSSGLNFIGNIEGKDIPAGVADVVITDGFTGNVIIKTTEGVAKMITTLIRAELTSSPISKLLAAGLRPSFRRIGDRLDYAEYGGSIVMGVNGVLIKPHGRSNAKAIKNAIRVARSAVEQDIMSVFREVGKAEAGRETVAG